MGIALNELFESIHLEGVKLHFRDSFQVYHSFKIYLGSLYIINYDERTQAKRHIPAKLLDRILIHLILLLQVVESVADVLSVSE
jgi:hypothetical protein